eukprot:g1376.t1
MGSGGAPGSDMVMVKAEGGKSGGSGSGSGSGSGGAGAGAQTGSLLSASVSASIMSSVAGPFNAEAYFPIDCDSPLHAIHAAELGISLSTSASSGGGGSVQQQLTMSSFMSQLYGSTRQARGCTLSVFGKRQRYEHRQRVRRQQQIRQAQLEQQQLRQQQYQRAQLQQRLEAMGTKAGSGGVGGQQAFAAGTSAGDDSSTGAGGGGDSSTGAVGGGGAGAGTGAAPAVQRESPSILDIGGVESNLDVGTEHAHLNGGAGGNMDATMMDADAEGHAGGSKFSLTDEGEGICMPIDGGMGMDMAMGAASAGGGAKPKLFVCDIGNCRRSFASAGGLKQHKNANHSKPGTWVCRVFGCGVDCGTLGARAVHERQ